MNLERDIKKRSDSKCELCGSVDDLTVYLVPPTKEEIDYAAMICNICLIQIEDINKIEINHWRCLNDSMWSEVPAVQALAWRMLNQLKDEGWPQDMLDMMYMNEETSEWAKSLEPDEDAVLHRHWSVPGLHAHAFRCAVACGHCGYAAGRGLAPHHARKAVFHHHGGGFVRDGV